MKRPPRFTAFLLACAMLTLTTGCDNAAPSPSQPPAGEVTQPSSALPENNTTQNDATIQETDKESDYQAVLTHFANGETCAAYQALMNLGDYKDSALLKEEIYLQNQLGFVTLGAADYFRANREAFALLPDYLVDEAFANKTWLVPNFQSHSYLEYVLAGDHTGEVYDPFLGQKFHDITWNVTENGFRIGMTDVITDQDDLHYQTEIRKAAEGVYVFYVLNAPDPLTGSDIVCYIDKNSDFGKRYMKTNAIIMDVIQNPSTDWYVDRDPYGLYFIVQSHH